MIVEIIFIESFMKVLWNGNQFDESELSINSIGYE